MTCSKCEKHGYTVMSPETGKPVLEIANGDIITGLARLQLWTHYCTATKGIRKIKFNNDWHGGEWPKWCPMKGGGQALETRQTANSAAETAVKFSPA